MLGLPSYEFYFMPKAELSDLIDAANIINGFCEENIETDYIPIGLR